MDPAQGPARGRTVLALRLRELREFGLGVSITQAQLARALGDLSVPLISSWESRTNPKPPPPERIEAYARLFATERSIDGDDVRLLDEAELTDEERDRRDQLERELTALRYGPRRAVNGSRVLPAEDPAPDLAPRGPTWRFVDGRTVTIVCGDLPADLTTRMPDADPSSPDYVELYAYSDLDTLLELHGHIRAANPANQVNIRLSSAMEPDDFSTHLVLLGGVDLNIVTRAMMRRLGLPLRQVSSRPASGGGPREAYFEVTTSAGGTERYRPVTEETSAGVVLVEDVAHFYRGPNPYDVNRTLTICNAIYGRGTLGAVRALTDAKFRDGNEGYIAARFGEDRQFSLLVRVPVVLGATLTPDWTQDDVRLHEWPEPR